MEESQTHVLTVVFAIIASSRCHSSWQPDGVALGVQCRSVGGETVSASGRPFESRLRTERFTADGVNAPVGRFLG